VLFRAQSLHLAGEFYHRLLTITPWAHPSPAPMIGFWLTVGLMLGCQVLHTKGLWFRPALRLPAFALGLGLAVLLSTALFLSPQDSKQFLYFKF
jgi:hypothetical protein